MGRKLHDLVGKQLGRIKVISRDIKVSSKLVYWKCLCECGNIFLAAGQGIRSGKTKSCGCLTKELSSKANSKDISNFRFGKLVAKEIVGKNDSGEHLWKCLCDCGKETIVSGCVLRRKKGTRSCGCLNNIQQREMTRGKSSKWKGFEEVSGLFFRRIVQGANARGLEVLINPKDVWDLYLAQNKKCKLTGIEINFPPAGLAGRSLGTVSVDRIDSSIGYTKENIQLVHKDLNSMKLDFSQEEFILYCNYVAVKHPRPIILT